jgi:predicted DNA-binding transcriptional regulator YafY
LNRWQDKIASVPPTMQLLPPVIDPQVLSSIQEAVLQERQVEVEYRRLTADAAEPILLHPLGLILRGNIMYLIATAYEYSDVRLYALHRMIGVIVHEENRVSPSGYTLAGYLDDGHGHFMSSKALLRLEAQLTSELGLSLKETPVSSDQQLTRTQSGYHLIATLPDTWELKWWILSQGCKCIIIGPPELKKIIVESITLISNIYNI